MTTTPYRPEAKENNLVDSYSQVGSVVARNTVIFDENGNAITLLSKDDVLDCYQTSDIDSYRDWETDRKSTRLNSSHRSLSRMPSSA